MSYGSPISLPFTVCIDAPSCKILTLNFTPKGTAVCKFTVAANRFYKREKEMQKEVSCFDVSAWTRLAEVCGE